MKYIALLRGINVGGNNKVDMKELKACFEKAGFRNVVTYINSGNVIFESDEEELTTLGKNCEDMLEQQFGFFIRTAVIRAESLQEALSHAPDWWGEDAESKHNVIFVIPPALAEKIIGEVGAIKPEYEKIGVYGNVIFWSAPLKTFTKTRWSKIVGSRAYQDVTIRNANTVRKLLERSR